MFQGWYYKQQLGEEILVIIAGYHYVEKQYHGFIQIIYEHQVYYFEDEVSFDKEWLVCIGKSRFSKEAIELNVQNEAISMKGHLLFSNQKTLNYPIMGPFILIPKMECFHAILSMRHRVCGQLLIQDVIHTIDGIGYIESDRGHSFPQKYCWLQSYDLKYESSLMLAVASIDYPLFHFQGIIAVLMIHQHEIRFASYLNAKVISCREDHVHLKQGRHELIVNYKLKEGLPLAAPVDSKMTRLIHESVECIGTVEYLYDNKSLYYDENIKLSVEYAGI